MESLVPLLALVGVGYFIYRLIQKTKGMHAAKVALYVDFAEKNQLSHFETKELHVRLNHMSGTIEGLKIQIFEQLEASGKNRQIHTTFRIVHDVDLANFNLFKKTRAGKLGKKMGVKYVDLNNPQFDENYMLRSEDENILQFFNSQFQNDLIENRDNYFGECANKDKFFVYVFRGALLKPEHFEQFEKMISVFIRKYKA
ncbi:MAG: hypothetical protein BM555_06445 [Crocinitomix sp. MedPE-SWsnd]|jgi:hypothetical protein|nr:MAG: hypothetical protein BM555_06445 [Crocinitomix sp. MedPE-SWsnd]